MKKKEMMFYKMCEAMKERFYKYEPPLFEYISCHNEIEIVFRRYSKYILVFKEIEVIKQIKKRRVNMKSSEIKEE